MARARVSVAKGGSRTECVSRALSVLEDDIRGSLKGAKEVLIKPNFVSCFRQLAATHVEAVRALMSFLARQGVHHFILAEGPAIGEAGDGFRNYGYGALAEEFDVEFIDLNQDDFIYVEVLDASFRPLEVRVAKTVVEAGYRISICPMKTHDTVVVTLSIKNMAVGAILKPDKPKIHQGYQAINLNIARLAQLVWPHLAVIDGFLGMEGSGPVSGDPVELGLALVSTDPLAADAVATSIMGFDPLEIGYLYYCGLLGLGEIRLDRIEVLGPDLSWIRKPFRPHPSYGEQLNWRTGLSEEEILGLLRIEGTCFKS